MRKLFLSMAIFATAIVGAAQADAGVGIVPSMTTYSLQAKDTQAAVKVRLLEVIDTHVMGISGDALLYRHNTADLWHTNSEGQEYCNHRRDLLIEVTEVIHLNDGFEKEVKVGTMKIVSPEQRNLDMLPSDVSSGNEFVAFLSRREDRKNAEGEVVEQGAWEFRGNMRGIMTEAGSEALVEDLVSYRHAATSADGFSSSTYASQAQDRMLEEITNFDSRLAVDALIDFGWNFNLYAGHFTAEESLQLLELLADTTPGSAMRNELITAIGRTLPEGGQAALVAMIANDPSASTVSLGAWALEQFGRGSSSEALLDVYSETTVDANRAGIVRALGLIRPKSYRATEANARNRFVSVLRSTVKRGESAEVMTEALIATRDMRFTGEEMHLSLVSVLADYSAGLIEDESIYKRAIVAMASARSEQAREHLLGLKGAFNKAYDKHIDLALEMPMLVLVDMR